MLCKPAAGNGGHKMSRYSWFTVYEEVTETDRIEYCFLIDKQAVIWYTKNKQRKVLC